MENQAELTQFFYFIQCQGNTVIVGTLSLLSTTIVNLANDASLRDFVSQEMFFFGYNVTGQL